jgi:hypothetical protein
MPRQVVSFGGMALSAAPSVYFQQLSTPELATSFAETFQQTTGRTLQYVTSVNSFQELATFPALPTVFQPIGPPIQSFLAPQFGYLPPQSIIVSPQTSFLTPGSQLMYNPATFSGYASASGGASAGFLQPPPPISAPRLYPQPSVVSTSLASAGTSGLSRLPASSLGASSSQKKVARVQPQPWIKTSETRIAPAAVSGQRLDPIKALSNMASHPMSSQEVSSSRLSIVHGSDQFSRDRNQQSLSDASGGTGDEVVFLSQTPSKSSSDLSPSSSKRARYELEKQRSVGTQAKLGGPLKIMTPRPWKGIDDLEPSRRVPAPLGSGNMSSGVSVSAGSSLAGSRPSSTFSSSEAAKPATPEISEMASTITLSSGIRLTKQKSLTASSIKIVMQKDGDRDGFKVWIL